MIWEVNLCISKICMWRLVLDKVRKPAFILLLICMFSNAVLFSRSLIVLIQKSALNIVRWALKPPKLLDFRNLLLLYFLQLVKLLRQLVGRVLSLLAGSSQRSLALDVRLFQVTTQFLKFGFTFLVYVNLINILYQYCMNIISINWKLLEEDGILPNASNFEDFSVNVTKMLLV